MLHQNVQDPVVLCGRVFTGCDTGSERNQQLNGTLGRNAPALKRLRLQNSAY